MKALLKTGEVVALTKDCACATHEGAHWVYVDSCWKEFSRSLLRRSCLPFLSDSARRLSRDRYAFEEFKRERSFLRQCDARGIEKIVGDDNLPPAQA